MARSKTPKALRRSPLKRKTPLKRGKPLNAKRKANKENPYSTTWRNKADKAFSLYIRSRDGCCCRCGSKENLQCSHVIVREVYPLRCDPENAIALCAKCHWWWHKRNVESGRWFDETWPGRYDRLREKEIAARQNRTGKIDWKETFDRLNRAQTLLSD